MTFYYQKILNKIKRDGTYIMSDKSYNDMLGSQRMHFDCELEMLGAVITPLDFPSRHRKIELLNKSA